MAPRLVVTPSSGASNVRPDARVVIRAHGGRLVDVRVSDVKGRALSGRVAADGATWTSTRPLQYAAGYWVRARAQGSAPNGGPPPVTDASEAFTTLKPADTLSTSVTPLDGSTVGVGMPVIVRFQERVKDRAAVERGLKVTASRPVTGAWNWLSDTEVHYRPKQYWPAYTDVTLTMRLRGVEAAPGLWGAKDRTVRFSVGPRMVSVVNAKSLRMTVTRDGKTLRTVPVTAGKQGFTTRSGIKLVHEKHVMKIMDARTINISPDDPEYYRLEVPYALRVTSSGEFVHGAPWSVGAQGRARVSHGCVGMSMTNARWFFGLTRIGDVISVVGTGRGLERGNGWTDWNVPWSEWQAGSAL